MARHNATKLLPLTSQTKLTLTLTLTLTQTLSLTLTVLNPNIYAHFVYTRIKKFFWIYKKFFRRGAQQGLWVGRIIALPICWFSCTQLSICQWEEIDHLSLKEGFYGVCIEKGLGLVGIELKKQRNWHFCRLKIA